MSRSLLCSYPAWLIGTMAVALAAAPAAPGDIFNSLPHLKKPHRPICNNYGECYGHFQVTYRPWPAHCVVNPPLAAPAKPLRETLPPPSSTPAREGLPSPVPVRESLPPPVPVPDDTPAKPGTGPVPGMLFEVEEDPALPARRQDARHQSESTGSPFPPRQ